MRAWIGRPVFARVGAARAVGLVARLAQRVRKAIAVSFATQHAEVGLAGAGETAFAHRTIARGHARCRAVHRRIGRASRRSARRGASGARGSAGRRSSAGARRGSAAARRVEPAIASAARRRRRSSSAGAAACRRVVARAREERASQKSCRNRHMSNTHSFTFLDTRASKHHLKTIDQSICRFAAAGLNVARTSGPLCTGGMAATPALASAAETADDTAVQFPPPAAAA